jgi:dihydroxy-acid dehydratase
MGMSLPGCASALAGQAKKHRIAFESGVAICDLTAKEITPSKILNENAFHNAIVADMALGGSTNTALHLPAIANEAGVSLDFNSFDRLSRITPHITSLNPGGEFYMEDLDNAGGIPAVQKQLLPLLKDNPTVSGYSVKEIAETAEVFDDNIIRPLSNPYHKEGGIAVLYGNIARDGAVIKQTAVNADMLVFTGSAKVFDGEEAAMTAIMGGGIQNGDVVVIRYEGPKGGPGMREMLSPTSAIMGLRLHNVALITDGRFSGGSRGPCVGHISPEAAEGGEIALIKNGDRISIDVPGRKIELLVSEAELAERKASWEKPPSKVKKGYLAKYQRTVKSAVTGGITNY